MEHRMHPEQVLIPRHPVAADFAAWLDDNVDPRDAEILQGLIDKGEARWIADPEVDGTWAIEHRDPSPYTRRHGTILLVAYEDGYDFEVSAEYDERKWGVQ